MNAERHSGEQLLESRRTCPPVGPDLMVQMRGQDASSIGEVLPLRGDFRDVRDVAEIVDDVNAKRRHAEQRRSRRNPTARDHEGRQREHRVDLRGRAEQHEHRADDPAQGWATPATGESTTATSENSAMSMFASFDGQHDCRRARGQRQDDSGSDRHASNQQTERTGTSRQSEQWRARTCATGRVPARRGGARDADTSAAGPTGRTDSRKEGRTRAAGTPTPP